ncbi:MAG: DUF4491 family protein [Muribaculaceae bacterium]|nr:DUF4491 family protein [Muribaculaceae bacterium]
MDNISVLLAQYHCQGLVVGLATFLVIGLFHPLVIKGEYYFGTGCWWVFLLLGIAGCVASVMIDDTVVSILCGVVAFSSFWSIGELFEQRKRVSKGWFPQNPARKARQRDRDNQEQA